MAAANTFNLNYAANASTSTAVGTTLAINGGAGSSANRNVVNVNVTADTPAERRFFLSRGLWRPSQFDGPGHRHKQHRPRRAGLDPQEVNFFGAAGNTDTATVTGPGGGTVISVTPTTANATDVFLGGTPEIMTPTSNLNNPGQQGGGSAPDLFLTGLVQATGLQVNGGTSGTNQLVVNATTKDSGGLTGTSAWGGSGMTFGSTPNSGTFTPLFKTSTIRTAGNAYDTITVNSGIRHTDGHNQ